MSTVDTVPARGPSRGHKKRERTRRQLLAAAVDVIAERGEAFSISDVTDRAAVSTGTFYNYFDDRDDLVAALVPEVLAAFADASAASVGDDDPVLRFATITAMVLRQAVVAPRRMRALLRLDGVQRAIVDGAVLDHLRADLAAGVAAGRFDVEPDAAALDVIVGAQLLAARRLVEGEASGDYPVRVVTQLLRSLGLDARRSTAVATEAVADAADLVAAP